MITKFVEYFDDQGLSLLMIKNGEIIFSSKEEGISLLMDAIESFGTCGLKESLVIDKVVGKAASLLICYLKAKYIYAKVISRPALNFLEKSGFDCKGEKIVDAIRSKGELCPFEKEAMDIDDPEEGYFRIRKLLKRIS